MSNQAINWVFDELHDLKPGPTLVMLALANFADEHGSCFPGQTTIAALARCSRRTVIRYLAELQSLGLVTVEARTFNDHTGRVHRTSNRYTLNIGKTIPTEGDNLSPSAGPAVHAECDRLSPSATECDKYATECDSSVTRSPSLRSTSKTPSLHPSPHEPVTVETAETVGTATPRGAAPDDAARETSPVMDFPNTPDDRVGDFNSPGNDFLAEETQPSHTATTDAGDSDRQLLAEVLPDVMQAIPPRDQARVATDIRERLAAGWTKHTIYAALNARALPQQVKTLTGLVRARLRNDVPATTPPITVRHRQQPVLRTSDGQVVNRRDIDTGKLAIAYRQAISQGDCPATTNRWQWAQQIGLEHFHLTPTAA